MAQIMLDTEELSLLIQSLNHCLATCHDKGPDQTTPCADCQKARALLEKLQKEVTA